MAHLAIEGKSLKGIRIFFLWFVCTLLNPNLICTKKRVQYDKAQHFSFLLHKNDAFFILISTPKVRNCTEVTDHQSMVMDEVRGEWHNTTATKKKMDKKDFCLVFSFAFLLSNEILFSKVQSSISGGQIFFLWT